MITIGYSTRQPNPEFQEYLKKSAGYPKINIIEKVNNGEKSLTEVYNEILTESQDDYVVLLHDDIYFEKSGWVRKVLKHFEDSDYGILGVAGTTYLPKSGQWWEDRSKMVGIVNHEHQGKKWESRYSDSLGGDIKQTVIVDGLFLAINKKRIKKTFNEEVKGFHMYDVDFCFRNYVEGVKVGVIFDVRVTHKSIGMTNEQWENNKIQFAETYADLLPQKIKKTKEDKLKILIGCLFFSTLTGSELYVFELAKTLVKKGHNVTVIANELGNELVNLATKFGIKTTSFKNAPGYKIGDGVWSIQTPNGVVQSEKDKLYKVSDVNYDVILTQHTPISESLCIMYPNIDKISINHSEIIELENPYIHPSIKKYICIRPEIQQYITGKFNIEEDKTTIIYNPIDGERFNTINTKDSNYILFVGAIERLRKNAIYDLAEYASSVDKEFWLVGKDKSDYLKEFLDNNKHVKHFPATRDVEKYVKNCSETGGIQLGRTTIEGWMCGKPGWIYNVDQDGYILDKQRYEVPSDLDKYDNKYVAEQIINEIIDLPHDDLIKDLSMGDIKPLVSIIIPIYNYIEKFKDTLKSVFDSTYKNIEVIIINDGSTNELVNSTLESLLPNPLIKIINQKNQGPGAARNNGIKYSNGEYILPLDADDMILPEYIESCVQILNLNKNISPVYCDTKHIGELQYEEKRPEWSMNRLIQGPFIVNCSMFRRKVFDEVGGYDTNLKGWEDYDMWIRMGKAGYVGKRIAKPLFIYFHHEKDGTVSTEANKNQQELYKTIMNKYGFL